MCTVAPKPSLASRLISNSISSAGVLIFAGAAALRLRLTLRGLCLSRISRQAKLTKAGGLGEHVAMAFLLIGDTPVALLLTLEQVGGTFGRYIGLSLRVIAHLANHARPCLV
jgi:hypothetical protein